MLAASTILQLRILINDNDIAQTYTDTQMSQFLCVGAAQLNSYLMGIGPTFTIDFTAYTVTPDPSDSTLVDQSAEQLLLLLTASVINDSEIKKLYASAGYKIVDDKSTIDTSAMLAGLKTRQTMYKLRFDELLRQYKLGNRTLGLAVGTPFDGATY